MEIKKNQNENFWLGIGLCFGALVGLIVGVGVNNILTGFTLGCAIGIVLGNIYDEVSAIKQVRKLKAIRIIRGKSIL